jgi:hypothetical protein
VDLDGRALAIGTTSLGITRFASRFLFLLVIMNFCLPLALKFVSPASRWKTIGLFTDGVQIFAVHLARRITA